MLSFRVLAAASLLVLAACGSSTESSSPGGPSEKVGATPPSASPTGPASDPCALLSKDDATALKLKHPGQPDTMDLGASCDFGQMTLTVIKPDVSEEGTELEAMSAVARTVLTHVT